MRRRERRGEKTTINSRQAANHDRHYRDLIVVVVDEPVERHDLYIRSASTENYRCLSQWQLNISGLLLTIIGVLLLFQKRQHRYDWWRWLGLVFIVAGTVCQIMANRV